MSQKLNELHNKLQSDNYDIDKDENGIFLNDYDIDIIIAEESLLISTSDGNYYVNTIDEALLIITNIKLINDLSKSLSSNGFRFREVDLTHVYVIEHTAFSENGTLFLETNDGGVESFSNPEEVIGRLEEISVESNL